MSQVVNQSSLDENLAILLQFGSSRGSDLTVDDDVIAREIQQQYQDNLTFDDAFIALKIQQEEACVHSQLHDDEGLARTLQDFEGDLQPSLSDDENLARYLQQVDDSADTTDEDIEETHHTHTRTSSIISPNVHDNENTDPEDMTYEELNELEESIGNVSRGLSEETISQLRTYKYGAKSKTRWCLFKKKKFVATDTQCSICLVDYAKGDKITTLPCNHIYHKDCISHWLRENNVCCVCKAVV